MEKKRKILIVEGDPVALQTITNILAALEFKLVSAESGEQALRLIKRSHFDVVIIDVALDGIDGFETLRRANESRPSLGPTIILTSDEDPKTSFQAARLGAFDYLVKDPLDSRGLKEAVIRAAKPEALLAYSKLNPCFRHRKLDCFDNLHLRGNVVFVGMPFSEKHVDIYRYAIRPTVEEFDLKCWRADEDKRIGDIACKLSEVLQSCRIAIMEISDLNANVCIEIGLAHGYGIQVVLLKRKDAGPVPTDLAGMLCLEYHNIDSLKLELASYLKANL